MSIQQGTVVIIDDDSDVVLAASLLLKQHVQNVFGFRDPKEFVESKKSYAQVFLIDMNYSIGHTQGDEGLDFIEYLKDNYPQAEIIAMTAYGEIETAVQSMKLGAFDFIEKPWSNSKLLSVVQNAFLAIDNAKVLAKRNNTSAQESDSLLTPLIGESASNLKLLRKIEGYSNRAGVLILLGENGVGKELVAMHVHKSLKNIRFELINTADRSRPNWEELKKLPEQTTVFIKNASVLTFEEWSLIADLSVRLKFILSSVEPMEMPDSLHLQMSEIAITPLRKRKEDIEDICFFYIDKYCTQFEKSNVTLSNVNLMKLKKYSWPNNIDELQQVLKKAIFNSKSGEVLQIEIPQPIASNSNRDLQIKDIERSHILSVLDQNQGNISRSAKQLGLTRAALYRRIKKYNLK